MSPEIASVIHRLLAKPDERLSIEQMAGIAGLSESHFRARFESEVGQAPVEYAMRMRIDEAKNLLRGGKRVTDVAFALGFASTQYFATVFKKFTGRNPSRYAD